MKRRSFLKGVMAAAAAVMIPLSITRFGETDLFEALTAPTTPNITWQSWEEIDIGVINFASVRKLKLYNGTHESPGTRPR